MKFRLSAEYGELSPVRNWQPHTGIDLAIPENTTLRAIGEGIVDKVFDGGAIGKGLSIKFPDGSRAIYGHMNEVSMKVGDKCSLGEVIGKSGNTGNSTGAHLHFGMKDSSGEFVDPTPLAERIGLMSGDHVSQGALTTLFNNTEHQGAMTKLFWKSSEGIREHVADVTTEIILGIFDALKDFLFGATLIGSAVLIILKVAGYKDGGRWAGVLMVSNILLKIIFGA